MLKIENLRFERGERLLFDNIDLELHTGQRVAITGRNGVGKSTLLDLIVGDLSPVKVVSACHSPGGSVTCARRFTHLLEQQSTM